MPVCATNFLCRNVSSIIYRADVSSLSLTSKINVVVVFYHTVLTVLFLHYTTVCVHACLYLLLCTTDSNLEIQNRRVSEYFQETIPLS